MEHNTATHALAALGHATRLSIFRLLVQAGSGGKLDAFRGTQPTEEAS